MVEKPIKIILDTNLWISFLISGNYKKLESILFNKEARLIFSDELLEEFITVVDRPKFHSFFSQKEIEKLLKFIYVYGEFVTVNSKINICRDKKDNFLLCLAEDSEADYLLTGDKDLLILKSIGESKIITITDFFEIEKL